MAEIDDIVATPASLTANSYGTLQECTDYLRIRPGGEAWLDLDTTQQRGTLLFAAILNDREIYWGRKTDPDQAMKFPRGVQTAGAEIVPVAIKQAQFESALDLARGSFLQREEFQEMQALGIRQYDADDTRIRMQPFLIEALPMYKLSSAARSLLGPYTETVIKVGRA